MYFFQTWFWQTAYEGTKLNGIYSNGIKVRKGGILWKTTQRYTLALTYNSAVEWASYIWIQTDTPTLRIPGKKRWPFTGIYQWYTSKLIYRYHWNNHLTTKKKSKEMVRNSIPTIYRNRQLNMVYHWTGSIKYTSVYSMVYFLSAFSTVYIRSGYILYPGQKNVTVQRKKSPMKWHFLDRCFDQLECILTD
jgi:hypothetical protein